MAAKGIARRIPGTPSSRPPMMREIRIHTEETPRLSPNSLGFRIYPSTVWRITVNKRNHSAATGLASTRIKLPSSAPTNGPKVGARLVTPTITETTAT